MTEGSDSRVLWVSTNENTDAERRHGIAAYPNQQLAGHICCIFLNFFAGLARREVTGADQSYLEGLLRPLAAKNCWTIAEISGASNPQAHQRLLRTASWDAQTLGAARREAVVETLGEPEGVLIFDETGFLKCGDQSVGVHRQYSGTAGKLKTVR